MANVNTNQNIQDNISKPKEQQGAQVPPMSTVKEFNNSKYEKYIPRITPGQQYDVGLDGGYSSWKLMFLNELSTIPTAVNYAIDTGIDYGENNVYAFENETLLVGEDAVGEAFTTLDYKFKYKYDPLLMIHSLLKLGALDLNRIDQDHLTIRIGLALGDWKHKNDYIERLQNINVDGKTFRFNNIKIIPQGAGVYLDSVIRLFNNVHPSLTSIIDIGFNTINYLAFIDGKPQKQYCRSYMGHGVSSIITSFANYLENEFGMSFSEQEAIRIFMKEKFIYNGAEQHQVVDTIYELKSNFIKKLRNSILVKEKKLLSTSEKVVFAGGGSNLLKGVQFPPNVVFAAEEAIYSNVRGYMLF